MKIWKKIKNGIAEFLEGLRIFWKDIRAESYRRVVQAFAAIIASVAVLLFFRFGGGDWVRDTWDQYVNKKEFYTQRQIRGLITDFETGDSLGNVLVAIVGQSADTALSGPGGDFTLKFLAHVDSIETTLSFIADGYQPRSKRHGIPLSEEMELVVQTFTLEKEKLE